MSALNTKNTISWSLGLIVMLLGIANLFLVHPVPGLIYLLMSLWFLPVVNNFLQHTLKFSIPFLVRVLLFILILWFTMSASNLGEFMGL